jgi:hypothetical protein
MKDARHKTVRLETQDKELNALTGQGWRRKREVRNWKKGANRK